MYQLNIAIFMALYHNVNIHRMCTMAYEAYVDLDELTAHGDAQDSFINETKVAHGPGILILLQSFLQINEEQFRRNVSWVAPMLSSLSVCDDRAIRSAVKLVYEKHLNPLVISTSTATIINTTSSK